MQREVRTIQTELRVKAEEEKHVVYGYAALFNSLSKDLGGFREKIRNGAFSETAEQDDVRVLFNHDSNYVLGRNTTNTARLIEDNNGLYYEVKVPDTQWARDLIVSIQRGDISQCSFSFSVEDEAWSSDDAGPIRELVKVRLSDVGPVTFPAYTDTSVSARAIEQSKELQKEKEEPQADKHKMAVRQKKLRLIEKTLEQTREV